jgi:hypothetical protein
MREFLRSWSAGLLGVCDWASKCVSWVELWQVSFLVNYCVMYTGKATAVAVQPVKESERKKKTSTKQRRVVVTGMGVVSCLGHDPDTFYDNLLAGKSGVTDIEGFDCKDFPTVGAR